MFTAASVLMNWIDVKYVSAIVRIFAVILNLVFSQFAFSLDQGL